MIWVLVSLICMLVFLFICFKNRFVFIKPDFIESTDILKNPFCGWYRMYVFDINTEPIDFESCRSSFVMRDTLVLLLINISYYKNKDLDSQAINKIREIFEFFDNNEYDLIVRIVYDKDGTCEMHEPSSFLQVESHIKQVCEILRDHPVFVFQGCLLGHWGEMHGSKFLNLKQIKRLFYLLSDYLKDSDIYLAVRKPVCYRQLSIDPKVNIKAIGLFDDAIFGSESDLGTFGVASDKFYFDSWIREDELKFESDLCLSVPNGGEAVYNPEFYDVLSQENVLAILKKMRITYLDRDYDKKLLDIWSSQVYRGSGVWHGKNVFDYISAHLGYRLFICDVQVKYKLNKCILCVSIKNIGFAPCYRPIDLYIDDRPVGCIVSLYPDYIQLCNIVVHGPGIYYLHARCQDKIVYFANACDPMGRVLLGSLGCV